LFALLWPLLRSISIRNRSDLALERNGHPLRDVLAGFLLAAFPLLCCGAFLIALRIFSVRTAINWLSFARLVGTAIVVPVIEETFFRGLVLGILLRSRRKYLAIFGTSALYAIVHFLKAPDQTSPIVTWASGFNSIAHSFRQFANPMLVMAVFTTLFLLGCILADARVRTRSLWLPIGLHGGWIFVRGAFQIVTQRELLVLPWLGKNLLVGIVPLALAGLTWILIRGWLKYADAGKT